MGLVSILCIAFLFINSVGNVEEFIIFAYYTKPAPSVHVPLQERSEFLQNFII
jgi:hypothetical protein